ncbi:hypothetical protein F4776DRAFT_671036 [Hypoxylon sp. NC0597]|nr:hypothetical protein F4776DRAFT_671036 [Hypoxylon sp. NC0597]
MSSKPTSTPEAGANGAKQQKWTGHDNAKLLLMVMQEGNDNLDVKGWANIGERVLDGFDGKYTAGAAKHQFQKLRREFINSTPASIKAQEDALEAVKKGRKRTSAAVDDDDDDKDKVKKARVAKKLTTGGSASSSNTAQGKTLPKPRTTRNSNKGKADPYYIDHDVIDDEVVDPMELDSDLDSEYEYVYMYATEPRRHISPYPIADSLIDNAADDADDGDADDAANDDGAFPSQPTKSGTSVLDEETQ